MTADEDLNWLRAYQWLCLRRRQAPPSAQVWHVRFFWDELKDEAYCAVREGRYRLKPMRIYPRANGKHHAQWDALDALVLKWLALTIEPHLAAASSL